VIRVRLVVIVVLAGCNALLGVHGETVGGATDGHGADGAAMDGSLCFGSFAIHCFTGDETDLTLPQLLDTSTDSNCGSVVTDACIVAANNINVGTGTRVTGSRPLAIFAFSNFTIGGETLLDAARVGPRARCE
jgi:hypothetical protein